MKKLYSPTQIICTPKPTIIEEVDLINEVVIIKKQYHNIENIWNDKLQKKINLYPGGHIPIEGMNIISDSDFNDLAYSDYFQIINPDRYEEKILVLINEYLDKDFYCKLYYDEDNTYNLYLVDDLDLKIQISSDIEEDSRYTTTSINRIISFFELDKEINEYNDTNF